MELRVPRASSQGTVKNRLDIMWEQLSPAFTPNDFVPWNLQRARRQLLADRKNHSDCYRAGTLEFVDSDSGKACFYPSTEDEGADGVAERVAAIDAYLAADESECHEVKITWLPKGSGGKLKDELRIVCGGKNSHEVVIAARTNSQAVDYVTSRLREFSRPSA
jgi:hypothetical protein